MKLHWSPKSPYVRKVMICAHELGSADRLELVRSVAAMLKPNARPHGGQPAVEDPDAGAATTARRCSIRS